MLKVTRWRPDTCACVLEYEWDTETPDAQRTHTIKNVVNACPAHVGHGVDKAAHYTAVLAENQRKNRVLNHIAENVPGFAIVDTENRKSPDLSKLSFGFDAERNIVISARGMSADDKIRMKTELEAVHGKDKVRLS